MVHMIASETKIILLFLKYSSSEARVLTIKELFHFIYSFWLFWQINKCPTLKKKVLKIINDGMVSFSKGNNNNTHTSLEPPSPK